MNAIKELAGVIVAVVLAFCGGIAFVVAFSMLWAGGVASGSCLMVALFAVVMFGIAGKAHDGQIALTYLGYAAVPFALTFVAGYYRGRFRREPIHAIHLNEIKCQVDPLALDFVNGHNGGRTAHIGSTRAM